MRRHFALALLLLAAALGRARADDAWIEPTQFTAPAERPLPVHLRVGREGRVRDVERRPARILRFVLRGPDGLEREVEGEAGQSPAGAAQVAGPGRYALGYHGRPNRAQLAPAAFTRLLYEEGLQALLAGRGAAEAAQLTYTRCAKSLLQVGEDPPAEADLPLGLPLELIVEAVPAAGEALRVRLLRDGAPVANARVRASSLERFTGARWARTDAAGRATLRLPHGGRWLLAAVVIEPEQASASRWASLWTSLTLALPGELPPDRSACATFAEVFGRARASGAAERVLGTHRFLMERRYTEADGTPEQGRLQRNLMSYTLSLSEEEEGEVLTVDVEVVPAGATPFHLIYRVSLADGRTAAMEAMAAATREGDTLQLYGGRGDRSQPWDDAILPKIVGVFVLPMLADQGLPDRLPFRDLTPFGDVSALYRLRPLAADEEGAKEGRLTYVTEEGRLTPTTYAHVDAESHLLTELHTVSSVHTLPTGAEVPAAVWHSERLSEEAFAELRADW